MPRKQNKINENYLEKMLESQNEHQEMMHKIVIEAIQEQEGLVKRLYDEENDTTSTFGQRVSDKVASFGGSWTFIFMFFVYLLGWMAFNDLAGKIAFDPFPFIFLNLILSCLAAIQAPIILMSGNRKETRDRKRAQDDYLINLKAELENRMTNQKLDLLINEQFKELIEIQKIQIAKMDIIENIILKNNASKASTKRPKISYIQERGKN